MTVGDLSKNFSLHEFRCNCHWKAPHLPGCEQIPPPKELVDALQDVRDHFGKPVTIHSGHRCPAYNKYVGGAEASQHMKAIAADFTVEGVSPNTVQEYLLKRCADTKGIGRYNTFTHIDVRKDKARWDYRR